MSIVEIEQAQTELSRLVDQAARGEEVILARDGTPAARIVPVAPLGPRRPPVGNPFHISIVGIFSDMDEEIADAFYASNLFPGESDSDT